MFEIFHKMKQLDIIAESEELKERQRQIGEKNLLLAARQFLLLDFSEVIKILKVKYVTEDDIIDTCRVSIAPYYSPEDLQDLVMNMFRGEWGDKENALLSRALDICSTRFLALEIYFEHRSQEK